MSEVQSAAAMFAGALALFLLAAFLLWRHSHPRAETAPRLPKAPKSAGEHKLPGLPALPRRRREEEAPVTIAPSRLARVSGTAPLAPLPEPEAMADPPPPYRELALSGWDEPEEESDAPEAAPTVEAMLDTMATRAGLGADIAAAHGAAAVSVRLVPHIPPRDAIHRRSWLGGRPRLSAAMDWPLVDGQPGDFLAQICCADLPVGLWDDLGPRTGWLAFFANPDSGQVAALHLAEDGPPRDPPRPAGPARFAPEGGIGFGDLAPFAIRAFPEWPVDLVAVRPGEPDPRDAVEPGLSSADLYRAGYDIADPAFHPFDWDSMLAMVAILERRLERLQTDPAPPADASDELALALADAAEMNAGVAAGVREIAAIVRESAGSHAFAAADATAVMAALHAIKWTQVVTHPNPETGEDEVEELVLPLTRHHPRADLWVHDYQAILFDRAKHAWCADPDRLSAPARAHFEPRWRSMAAAEMAAMGHVPFGGVAGFDDERDAVLLELPASGLMSRHAGEGPSLVLTLAKAHLAVGDFTKLKTQPGC